MELFVCHKMVIDEKEFVDYKLFESLYDQLSKKDLDSIFEMFQDEDQKENKDSK